MLLVHRQKWEMVMIPHLIIVGADKGGVGKTTISRTLMDYFKTHGVDHRAYDTQYPAGVLARFHKDKTTVVDLMKSDDQMKVLDNLRQSAITLIDCQAGLLTFTLKTLSVTGFLERMRQNRLRITVLHIIGSSKASFDEIKACSGLMQGSRHILVANHINDAAFIGLSEELKSVAQGQVVIPKLIERATEHVDASGLSYSAFIDDPNESETLRGYTNSWLQDVFRQYDSIQLSAVG